MSLLRTLQGEHEIVNETFTIPTSQGLNLKLSSLGGYSPIFDGALRILHAEAAESLKVHVNIRASSASYTENVKVRQNGNDITVATGGLSYWASIGARMYVEVTVSLPRGSGDVNVHSPQLPIVVQSGERAGDVVLRTESASISVGDIGAKSLLVVSQSGSVTLESSSEQIADDFITVETRSGGIKCLSSLLSPKLMVQSQSGTISTVAATNAGEIRIKNGSGSINADLDLMDVASSDTAMECGSGSVSAKLRRWSGLVTAQSKSGSRSVRGDGVVQDKDGGGGWHKGSGDAKLAVTTKSGSIKVELL